MFQWVLTCIGIHNMYLCMIYAIGCGGQIASHSRKASNEVPKKNSFKALQYSKCDFTTARKTLQFTLSGLQPFERKAKDEESWEKNPWPRRHCLSHFSFWKSIYVKQNTTCKERYGGRGENANSCDKFFERGENSPFISDKFPRWRTLPLSHSRFVTKFSQWGRDISGSLKIICLCKFARNMDKIQRNKITSHP